MGFIVASAALERTPAISQSAEGRCQSYVSVPSVAAAQLGIWMIAKPLYFVEVDKRCEF